MAELMQSAYVTLRSQTQLCERLALLTRFSSLLVFVAGESGAGKSSIIQQYLEMQPDVNQALINSSASIESASFRQQLVSQLYPSATFDAQKTVPDIMVPLLEVPSQNLLVIVDDAHYLPEQIVSELWELQLDNRAAGYPNQINILLFANSEWVNEKFSLLKLHGEEPPVEMEIAPLSETESTAFVKFYMRRASEHSIDSPAALEDVILQGLGIPGLLYDAIFPAERATKERDKSRILSELVERLSRIRFSSSAMRIMAIVLASLFLAVLVLAGYYHSSLEEKAPEAVELKLPSASSDDVSQVTESAAESEPDSEPLAGNWSKKQESLPEPIAEDTLKLESPQDNRTRVVISDEQVNKIIEKSTPLPSEQPEERPTPEPKAVEQVKEIASEPAKAVVEVKPKRVTAAVNTKSPTVDYVSLLRAKPAKHYTLQLTGLSDEATLNKFIATHNLKDKAWHYKTSYKGNPWYVVVMGDYPSLEQSRTAIEQLPTQLRAMSPWSKSFAAVHKDLDRVK